MLSLLNRASVEAALTSPMIDPDLRDLIARRTGQLDVEPDRDLGEVVQFHAVEPGDHLTVIDAALGFPILQNLATGEQFGWPEFTPSFEWMQDHGRWFEVVYTLTDDFGVIVFVKDDPGIEFDVHALCLEYAGRPC